MGEHGDAAGGRRQPGRGRGGQPLLLDVGGPALGQPAVEGLLDAAHHALAHQNGGGVGTPDARASGLGDHLVVGDGQTQLGHALGQAQVPRRAGLLEADELELEGTVSGLDEVDEHVHGPRVPLAGQLTAGHELHAGSGRAGGGGREPVQAVVIGQGHGPAPGRGRQLADAPGRFGAVGHGGVDVQVDHGGATVAAAVEPGAAPSVWDNGAVVAPHLGGEVPPPYPDVPDDDSPKEACGVFGVYATGQAVALLTFDGLYALQHRGQESAGMAVSDGETVTVVKDMGLVTNVFDERTLAPLQGHLAIGHTRYSTTGSSTWHNAQPVYRAVGEAGFALGHNGNLTNTPALAAEAGMLPGVVTSDSDLVGELVSREFPKEPRNDGRDLEVTLAKVLPRLEGAFSFVLMDTALPSPLPGQARLGVGAGLRVARPGHHRRPLRARDRAG